MKKMLVIADIVHKDGFRYIFEQADINPRYISDEAPCSHPYTPKNVKKHILEKGREYAGAFVCGCCGDSLETVMSSFPGKVVFLNMGGAGMANVPEGKLSRMLEYVDLYLKGCQFSDDASPKLKNLFA